MSPPLPRLLSREGGLWVFDKPAGFAVHPTGDPAVPDLLGWARASAGASDALRPAHRLDRETSGVLLAAEDDALLAELGRIFREGTAVKRYRALVHGRTHQKGIVRTPLGDQRRGAALEAVTRFRLLAWLGPTSYLEVRPASGRRHQIRRHLQRIGHSIVGDDRYPPKRFRPVVGFPGRLWLHAESITLPDGRLFVAPLAPELERHLTLLESLGTPANKRGSVP
jgi:23S rRNA-/tRNA-specific pseudouridylate synthase